MIGLNLINLIIFELATSQKCEDINPKCQELSFKSCPLENHRAFMTANCKKTCLMCGSNNVNFDHDSACKYWRDNKQYCNPGYYCHGVVKKCQYSCNYNPDKRCTLPPTPPSPYLCEDKQPKECQKLGLMQCKFKREFMSLNCMKTCQMCGDRNLNYDRDSVCRYWKEQGYCDRSNFYCRGVVKECKYTCNYDPDKWCQ